MESKAKMALAIAVAFGLGAVTVEGLRAQAKPAVYAVTEIEVKNMDPYMKDYAPKAQALIKKSGGKILAATSSPTSIEGRPATPRVALQQWENMDKYMAYRNSAEFKEVRALGGKYATFRTIAVEALPQ